MDAILVLNAGSSTLKFSLHEASSLVRVAAGQIDRGSRLTAHGDDAHAQAVADAVPRFVPVSGTGSALAGSGSDAGALIDWLERSLPDLQVVAAGHRVVHGGQRFVEPVRIDDAVFEAMQALTPLAPLHQPANLAPIRALRAHHPRLPQVACFDTAFHATQPELSTRMPLPRELHERGVRRYGFHGLSYDWISRRLPGLLGRAAEGAVVVAHLGNGSSACAMRACRSVATSMGYTALDGLMMGTRCGAIDPGVVLHLVEQAGGSAREAAAQVTDLLYRRSGLLGVSGRSADMRVLEQADDAPAREAIELYCQSAARQIASLATSARGLDALVFTAGIGEHDPRVRARICEWLAWTGLRLDADRNAVARGGEPAALHARDSRIQAWMIPTDEERVIAQATAALVGRGRATPA